jgi:hypothetical protein
MTCTCADATPYTTSLYDNKVSPTSSRSGSAIASITVGWWIIDETIDRETQVEGKRSVKVLNCTPLTFEPIARHRRLFRDPVLWGVHKRAEWYFTYSVRHRLDREIVFSTQVSIKQLDSLHITKHHSIEDDRSIAMEGIHTCIRHINFMLPIDGGLSG